MKLTPEIKKFIEDNNNLSARALSGLIESNFGIKISHVSIAEYLQKARAEAQANNNAKVEAVRSKILDDADRWANKYLKYLDEEVESLKAIKESGQQKFVAEGKERIIEIADIKDRISISQALHKYLTTVVEFVKPGDNSQMSDDDSDAKLDLLIARRNARRKLRDN